LLTTGNQLKAARALIGMNQGDLAKRAQLNINTIQNMEGAGAGPIAGRAANVQAVQVTLEEAGIEFLNSDRPGVRLKAP
jgi:transcriptional regulator with XRE-family HTH domain